MTWRGLPPYRKGVRVVPVYDGKGGSPFYNISFADQQSFMDVKSLDDKRLSPALAVFNDKFDRAAHGER